MLQVKLDFNLRDEPLNKFGSNFLKADLFSCIDWPGLVVDSKAYISKPPFAEHFAKLELLTEGVAVLDLAEDTGSLWLLLIRCVSIRWSQHIHWVYAGLNQVFGWGYYCVDGIYID